MSSRADLFVVCKQCGSEVSPYITECPYCGHRLRQRAPKLPRERDAGGPDKRRSRIGAPSFGPVRGARRLREWLGPDAGTPPYATIALVLVSCGVWVWWHWDPAFVFAHLPIAGPLRGSWWRLLTAQFTYFHGLYAFATLVAVAIFGWLLERRHGPLVVLALFVMAGVGGALVAEAVGSATVLHVAGAQGPQTLTFYTVITGGNGAAMGLLAAWAAQDLRAARARSYYEGDLLGTAAIAAVVLAMPLAVKEASWVVGVTGGVVGLALGLGLSRVGASD